MGVQLFIARVGVQTYLLVRNHIPLVLDGGGTSARLHVKQNNPLQSPEQQSAKSLYNCGKEAIRAPLPIPIL